MKMKQHWTTKSLVLLLALSVVGCGSVKHRRLRDKGLDYLEATEGASLDFSQLPNAAHPSQRFAVPKISANAHQGPVNLAPESLGIEDFIGS